MYEPMSYSRVIDPVERVEFKKTNTGKVLHGRWKNLSKYPVYIESFENRYYQACKEKNEKIKAKQLVTDQERTKQQMISQ